MSYSRLDNSIAMDMTMDICGILLTNGADISRVEAAIKELCDAFKIKHVETLVIPSFITITYVDAQDIKHTASHRFSESGTNLSKIEKACILISNIKEGKIKLDKINEDIVELKSVEKSNIIKRIATYIGVASVFTLIFLNTAIFELGWIEIILHIISAAICSSVIFGVDTLLTKAQISDIFAKVLLAIVTVLSIYLCNKVVDAIEVDIFYSFSVLMGNIMLIVPGIKFTNGIRDLFSGDTASATIHVVDAVFGTIGIVVGVLLMRSVLVYKLTSVSQVNDVVIKSTEYILASTALTGLGTVCFAMYFKICKKHLLLSFIAGSTTWLIYFLVNEFMPILGNGIQNTKDTISISEVWSINQFCKWIQTLRDGGPLFAKSSEVNNTIIFKYADVFFPNFFAAVYATLFSESIARNRKIPTMIFLFPAIVSLIPGGALYTGVDSAMNLENSRQTSTIVEALYAAGGISCGILIITAARRMGSAILEIIYSKSAGDSKIDEMNRECKDLLEKANYWYDTATKHKKNDPQTAMNYYVNAANQYSKAIRKISKCNKSEVVNLAYEAYIKSGINYFWLYRCALDLNKTLLADGYINKAKKRYDKAIIILETMGFSDGEYDKKKCELYNWMAVMHINEARYENDSDKRRELLDNANIMLDKATSLDPNFVNVYQNKAEVAFARVGELLGLSFDSHISFAKIRKSVNEKELEKLFAVIQENIYSAITCNPNIASLRYKMAQMYTYRILYQMRYKKKKVDELLDYRKSAEEWLMKAAQINPDDLGYLFVCREYFEIVDKEKAWIINQRIKKLDPNKADRWQKVMNYRKVS